MYPEQDSTGNQTVPQQTDLDYLNQISIKPTVGKFQFSNKKFLILIAVITLLIITLIVMAVVNNNSNKSPNSEVLSARLSGLTSLIEFSSSNPTNNSNLNKAVAEISLTASSGKYLLTSTSGLASPSKEVTAAESVDSVIKDLEKAKTIGNLGQAYGEALNTQIENINKSLTDIAHNSTSKQTIDRVISDFKELQARLVAN
jgi:hypothetical protein